MQIRPLGEHDAAPYWDLRLEALQNEPFAFGKAAEEHQGTSVEATAIRFRDMPKDSFTLAAFEGDKLIGIATFIRETGLKERHKGHIYGVYVTASQRGKGLGHALIDGVLTKAKEDPSLEQILYGTEPRALKVNSDYIDENHMVRFVGQPIQAADTLSAGLAG